MALPLLFVNLDLAAAGWRSQSDFDSFSYSAPVPIATVANDWDAPLHSGNTILSWNRVTVGIERDGARLALTRRALWQARLNDTTTRFIHLTKNHQPLPVGSAFPLSLQVEQYDLSGVEVALPIQLTQALTLTLTPAWLRGEQLTVATLQGSATISAANDYNLQLEVDTLYRDDPLFGRINDAPSGQGYALDLALHYRVNHALTAELELFNSLSRIWWSAVPATRASANTQTKQYDSDGYLLFRPTLSGLEYQRNWVGTLQRRTLARIDWRLVPGWGVGLEHLASAPLDASSFTLSHFGAYAGELRFGYTPRLGSLSVGWSNPYIGLTLGADATSPSKLHQLSLSFTLDLPISTF